MATEKKPAAKKVAAKKTGLKPGKDVTAVHVKQSDASGQSASSTVEKKPAVKTVAKKASTKPAVKKVPGTDEAWDKGTLGRDASTAKKVAVSSATKAKAVAEAPVAQSAPAPATDKPAVAPSPVVRTSATSAVMAPVGKPVAVTSTIKPPPPRTGAPKQAPRPPPPAPAPTPVVAVAPAAPTPPPPPEPPVQKSPVRFHEEMAPSIRPSNVKKFPLIPLFGDSSLSQNNFTRPLGITVDMPDGSAVQVKSGFLAFNKSIELLLLSSNNEWLEAKHVTETDHISDDLKLLAICGNLDGQNVNIQVKPEEHVFRPAVGDARYCTIESEFSYVTENRRVFLIKISGNINLDSGRAYLTAASNKPEFEPLGFFLQGSRQSFVK